MTDNNEDRQPMINDQLPTTDDKLPMIDTQGPTTNDRWPMTHNQRPTIDDRQPMTNDWRPTTDDRWPTTDDRWLTNNKQRRKFLAREQKRQDDLDLNEYIDQRIQWSEDGTTEMEKVQQSKGRLVVNTLHTLPTHEPVGLREFNKF